MTSFITTARSFWVKQIIAFGLIQSLEAKAHTPAPAHLHMPVVSLQRVKVAGLCRGLSQTIAALNGTCGAFSPRERTIFPGLQVQLWAWPLLLSLLLES